MPTRNRWVASLLVAGLWAVPASAQTVPAVRSGWFAGFSTGQATLQNFRRTNTTSLDDTSLTWSAFASYRFTRFLAASGGFLRLGDFHVVGADFFGPYTEDLDIKGFDAVAIAIVPVSPRVEAFGSIGAYTWTYNYAGNDIVDPNRNLSKTATTPTYGAGVSISLVPRRLSLQAGWRYFQNVGDRNAVEHINNYHLIVITGLTYFVRP